MPGEEFEETKEYKSWSLATANNYYGGTVAELKELFSSDDSKNLSPEEQFVIFVRSQKSLLQAWVESCDSNSALSPAVAAERTEVQEELNGVTKFIEGYDNSKRTTLPFIEGSAMEIIAARVALMRSQADAETTFVKNFPDGQKMFGKLVSAYDQAKKDLNLKVSHR